MRLIVFSLLWAVCLVGTAQLFEAGLVPPGGLTWATATVPAAAGGALLWAWFELVRQADELQRRIQLHALSLSFGITIFGVIAWQGFQRAGAPPLSLDHVVLLMTVLYTGLFLYGRFLYR